MEHLFAYGTLMCEDIMEEVSGLRLSSTPATLLGYRRVGVIGEPYPALVPDADGHVEGVIYRDVPASAWSRLDRFEGEMYSREIVQVKLADGRALAAATYIVRPDFRNCLDEREWDSGVFLREGKDAFRRSYRGG